MAQPYRFRPAFGQVRSLFRGARATNYPVFSVYRRLDGTSFYRQPDGTSLYKRPAS